MLSANRFNGQKGIISIFCIKYVAHVNGSLGP